MNEMNQRVKALWVEALRSGNYQQGNGVLRRSVKDGPDKFCCLGVLCELAVWEGVIEAPEAEVNGWHYYDGAPFALNSRVMKWAGMPTSEGWYCNGEDEDSLVNVNDAGVPFTEIADIIEKHF